MTDANGYFTMPGLSPGTYETRASLEGFGIGFGAVRWLSRRRRGLNLTLKVSGTEQSITVVADA